ncbi:MAG: hypothetical protein WCK82_01425 [Bacteroidota bacterium]
MKSNISPQKSIEPMSELDFYDRNVKSQKDIKKGNLISQTEMKKKFTKKELIILHSKAKLSSLLPYIEQGIACYK